MNTMNTAAVRVVDPVLTTVAQGYKNAQFVGTRILPSVPVGLSGGQILSFGKEAFLNYNLKRTPGGTVKRIQFGYLGLPYALLQDSVEMIVPREWLRDASIMPGIDLGTRAVNLGMNVVMKSLEGDIATLVLDSTKYPVANVEALAGAAKWSDPSSKPIEEIEDHKETVRQSIGVKPNLMTFSAVAWKAFRTNPNVLDRFKYTTADSITEQMIARLLQLEEVQVGEAVTADDTGAFSDVWGNNAVLSYSPKNPTGPEQPSFGYTYTLNGNPSVEQVYWDPTAKSWIYPANYERVPVIAANAGAFLIQNPA